jgi:predicted nucleic acid-binding protein
MMAEATKVVDHVRPGSQDAADRLLRSFAAIEVVERGIYVPTVPEAQRSLLLAPASRNGSVKDAHILALAWTYDADIWSHDRDFAGTGWPSWSSVNLAAALSEEAASASARQP